jgi:hypothetical protein
VEIHVLLVWIAQVQWMGVQVVVAVDSVLPQIQINAINRALPMISVQVQLMDV